MHLILIKKTLMTVLCMALLLPITSGLARSAELDQVLKNGKLRHLGIIYANFIAEDKTGLDVELMQRFAAHLGVTYEFVETDWQNILPDLTGVAVRPQGEDVEMIGERPVRGDVIATGFTVLPWRKQVVDFSETTFPTGVWLIARADSRLRPVAPTGDIEHDIAAVKAGLSGVSVLGLKDSCLDPMLYNLNATGADIHLFPADRNLDGMIPSVIANMVDATLMDVPVALIALEKWPGEIKVVGPISPPQEMACAFTKDAPELRRAFDLFLARLKADGTYKQLVLKYYPSLFLYYPDFPAN